MRKALIISFLGILFSLIALYFRTGSWSYTFSGNVYAKAHYRGTSLVFREVYIPTRPESRNTVFIDLGIDQINISATPLSELHKLLPGFKLNTAGGETSISGFVDGNLISFSTANVLVEQVHLLALSNGSSKNDHPTPINIRIVNKPPLNLPAQLNTLTNIFGPHLERRRHFMIDF